MALSSNPKQLEVVQEVKILDNNAVYNAGTLTTVAGNGNSGSYLSVRWYNSGINGITTPYDGMKIMIKIPLAGVGTAGAMLSINGNTDSEYHPLAYNVSTVLTSHYAVNSYKIFTYDASAKMDCYKTSNTKVNVTGVWKGEANYDSNTTITYGTLGYYFRPYAGANRITRYKLIAFDKDNRAIPITTEQYVGDYSSSTTYAINEVVTVSGVFYKSLQASNKNHAPASSASYWQAITPFTPNPTPFRPDKIWFLNTTNAYAAGAVLGGQVLVNVGYSTAGCTYNFYGSISATSAGIAAYKLIYLCGTYNKTTGLFTLDTTSNTSYYTIAPDNTANITLSSYFTSGKDYIFVGSTYSSNNYFQLHEINTMYHFDGTNLVPYDTYHANTKQDTLVSGTNIKTINGSSILGSGDMTIAGGVSDVQVNGSSVVSNGVASLGTAASANTGTSSGNVPVLDSNGKLDTSTIPAVAITDTYVVASEAAMLALSAQVGDIAIRSDVGKSYVLQTEPATTLSNWKELLNVVDISGKMNKSEPTGSGALSINRASNTTKGNYSVALNWYNTASAEDSTAFGSYTTASGVRSFTEGLYTTASGYQSHAMGDHTTANHKSQFVFGEYNTPDASANAASARGNYVEIVGGGSDSEHTHNLRTLDWSGNELLSGSLTASSIVKNGGTSAQFLKADGSVDSNTYLTSAPVTSVNTQTGAVTLTASDVGALPSSTAIPTKTSDLTNDSGFLTSAPSNMVTTDTAQTISALKTITAGLKVSGRPVGSGDDEGIVIGTASNNYAGVCCGSPSGRRAVFYLKPSASSGNSIWRYNSGSASYDIAHPEKSGTIALTSDIPSAVTESTVSGWGFTKNTGTITGVQLNGTTVASSGTANVQALPNFSLNISHQTAGNPRQVKFLTVNYNTAATYFKMSATSCHDNGTSYQFLEDIIIGCTTSGTVVCNVYKYCQAEVTLDNVTRNYGDVFYVIDTTNKVVDFYILCGQYATSQFTPATKIGNTTIAYITQYTGTATYYSSGTKVWADGDSTKYARLSDIPTNIAKMDLSTQTGSFYATSFYASSDERLKENIKPAELNCGQVIDKLQIKEFNFKADEEKKVVVGAIAQELKAILPEKYQAELVGGSEDTQYTINEGKLLFVAIGALKEEREKTKELEERLARLEELIKG